MERGRPSWWERLYQQLTEDRHVETMVTLLLDFAGRLLVEMDKARKEQNWVKVKELLAVYGTVLDLVSKTYAVLERILG